MKRNNQVQLHKLARQQGLIYDYERPFASQLTEDLSLGPYTGFTPNKTLPIHRWFQCREGYSRHLVQTFVERFTRPSQFVFDPFAGVGETLLTSKELGRYSLGIELLPLFTFVSNAKIRQDSYNIPVLRTFLSSLEHLILRQAEDIVDDFAIIRKGFPDRRLVRQILFLSDWIERNLPIPERGLARLSLIAASGYASFLIKDGAFPREVKRQPKELKSAVSEYLSSYITDLCSYRQTLFLPLHSPSSAEVIQGDSRDRNLYSSLPKMDLVLTSPPYLNRYDYTRIYEPELALFFTHTKRDMRAVRFSSIRSHVETTHDDKRTILSRTLSLVIDTLLEIGVNNRLIPNMVAGYFEDLKQVLINCSLHLRPNARVILVVGNVFYSGTLVPVDIILAEVANEIGLDVEQIIITKYKGTSEQQIARYGLDQITRHLSRESILILRA